MTYTSNLNSRERILLLGGPGTGKSFGAYKLAKAMSKGVTYVIDNDFSWGRMFEVEGDINSDLTEVYSDDWAYFMDKLEAIVEASTSDDVLIIDSITPTWQAVQDWYAGEIFGKSLDQFFLDARKQMSGNKVEGFDGWKDWSVINKVYGRMYHLLNRFKGHVILTAEAEPVTAETDPELKKVYGRVKHRGQKSLPHRVNTILQLAKTRQDEYSFTTVKDRNRMRMEETPYGEDLSIAYLIGVAGWTRES